ncbi:MAG TPA: S41 family peptidase [Mycobacteriales bacterium]
MHAPRVTRTGAALLAVVCGAAAVGGAFLVGLLLGRGQRPAPSVVDQAIAAIQAHADGSHSTRDLDAAAVRGLLSGLDDSWAAYYGVGTDETSQNQLRALLDGRYSGLGVWLRRVGPEQGIAVASVVPGSPAEAAGIRPGDQVLAVDGTDVSRESVDDVSQALAGPSGSRVSLLVRDGGGADRTVSLDRGELPVSAVSSTPPTAGIVTIRVATFSRGSGGQVQQAVRRAEAEHAKGIVLDLRGDPGGLLSEAVTTASAFLDGGPVVHLSGRTVPAQTLSATAGGDVTTPVAVLVDGGTASAAEIVAGALHDRDRAVLVGSKTFGKGSVQQVVPLSDGSSFELTVATYTTPDGHAVDGVGISPDVVVPESDPPSVAPERAVQILQALSGS